MNIEAKLILEKTYSTSSENKNSLSDSKEKEVDQMKLYPEQKKNGNFSEVKIGGHEEKEDVIPVSCSNPQASTPSGFINNKMEAQINLENNCHGLNKNDIKVEDFFVNDQNTIINNPQQEATEINVKLDDDSVIKNLEDEKVKIEEQNEPGIRTGDELFVNENIEVKYSKIPEFDEENRKTKNGKKINNKLHGDSNGQKAKNKHVILDEEAKNNDSNEENKEAEKISDEINLVLDENADKNGHAKKSHLKKSEPKKAKKEKIEKFKIEGDDEELQSYVTIVDLDEIKKKPKIENADIILCLIEICTNSLKYGLKNSNKSRLFWDELFKKPEISSVFTTFKSETLRKYWRLINELDKTEKVIETTRKYADQINKDNVKLLTIINAICDSVKGKHKSLENYFATISSTKAKKSSANGKSKMTKKKRKREADSEDTIENDLILISKNIEKSKQEIMEAEEMEEEELEKELEAQYEDEYDEDEIQSDDEPYELSQFDELNEKKNKKKRLTRHQITTINKFIQISEKEKNTFDSIDEVLNVFSSQFPNLTRDQIVDIFKKNSFNLENSFLQLINPEKFEGIIFKNLQLYKIIEKCFTEADDYIIQNLKETEYYEYLLDKKGESLVKMRHIFLNIEDDS